MAHGAHDRDHRTLEALGAVTRLFSSQPDDRRIFDVIAEAAVLLPGARVARVWADDPSSEMLREQGRFGTDEISLRVLCDTVQVRYGEGPVGRAFLSGVAQFITDIQEHGVPRDTNLARAAGLHGFAGIPLAVGSSVLGVLSINYGEPREFTAAEKDAMMLLGRQAAVAIHTARLLEQNERRRQTAEGLARLARSVSQSLEAPDIARRALDAVVEVVGAQAAAVLRADRAGDIVVLASCGEIGSVVQGGTVFRNGVGIPAVAVHGGRPAMTADVLTDPRIDLTQEARASIEAMTLRTALSVPLVANDTVIGLLALWNGARLYSLDEIALAQAFADQVALALENARLYEEAQRAYTELRETQQRLAQTQKMEAIGRLAGGVAHDFNNLLTIILGRADIAKRRAQCDDATLNDLALIEATASRAGALTKQLLAFSRKKPLRAKVVDLNDLISQMETMLRRLIGEDVDFITVLTPALGMVEADPGQLEQVLLNLVVNARDAMPQGGCLRIETDNVVFDETTTPPGEGCRSGACVALRVTDTGHGMDADTQARLFEPFFTTKDPGRGTGLGLPTVYGIVRQSGGHIAVESKPDVGTTFTIYLPRTAERSAPVDVDATAAAGGSETILLVEDEAPVRELVAEVLQDCGYRVIEAADGIEGARVADEHRGRIDLLLTDVVMPGLAGPGLAARLEDRRPETGVLFMSGYTNDAITNYGVSGAGEDLLHKPFSPDQLVRKVRAAIDASRMVAVR